MRYALANAPYDIKLVRYALANAPYDLCFCLWRLSLIKTKSR
ncbi:hypothetical protein PN437_17455 [Microcystis aeruginosa CS-564/01]|nr:hypothetical protein [Microcystis aeruginosa]MDB9426650.1 hypothetical protein [Microcystis aeruginosa CS-564/01]